MTTAQEQIYSSATTEVARTRHPGTDGAEEETSRIEKALKPAAQSPQAIARYHHEFHLNQSLTSPYVCRALAFDELGNRIIYEDVGGRSLREWLREDSLSFDAKLQTAVQIARAVQSIHDEGVIHRDINPGNVLLRLDDKGHPSVWLIDFGLATLAQREATNAEVSATQSGSLSGTLPYIAPEQTGRVNRVVDYRTDLYSMGATFFELFSGSPPFTNTDPLELIHAHIASTPPALSSRCEDASTWLSELVAKLLAKQPESRYQSAGSVVDDLLEGLRQGNAITFKLGTTDAPSQLSLPRKLYGRDDAVAAATDFIERGLKGETLFYLAHGGPGMGKNALTNTLAREAQKAGYLVARHRVGDENAEAEERDVWLGLIRPLLRQLFSSSEEAHSRFTARLTQQDSANLHALASRLPELASLLAEAPADDGDVMTGISELLTMLTPLPVCLVLDNIDLLSDETLETFTRKIIRYSHVLLIANAESADLQAFAAPAIATKSHLYELALLEKSNIRALLADMLGHSEARVRELAAELHAKTDGLPAHLLELIFELHHNHLINHDAASQSWSWDLEAVRGHYFSHSTIERVARLVKDLPESTQLLLAQAACLDTAFDAEALSALSEPGNDGGATSGKSQIASLLRPAITAGLLASSDMDRYQFSHPRVRATIYGAVTDAHKRIIHERIATWMQEQSASRGFSSVVIANHLHATVDPLEDPPEKRRKAAELGLIAARELMEGGQYQAAYRFCRFSLLLTDNHGDPGSAGALNLELKHTAAEAAFLCGDFDQLSRIAQPDRTTDSSLKEILIRAALLQNDLKLARNLCQVTLMDLGYATRTHPFSELRNILASYTRRPELSALGTGDSSLPALSEPNLQQSLRVVGYLAHLNNHLGAPGNRQLLDHAIITARRNGYSAEVAFCYAARASRAVADGHIGLATRLATDARTIAERHGDGLFAQRALVLLNSHVDPWSSDIDTSLESLSNSLQQCSRSRDFEFAAYASANLCLNSLMRGQELATLRRHVNDQLDDLTPVGCVSGLNITAFVQRIVTSLLGETDDDGAADDVALRIDNPEDAFAFGTVYTLRTYYAVLFQDFKGGATTLGLTRNYLTALGASPVALLQALSESIVVLRTDAADALATARRNREFLSRAARQGCRLAEPKIGLVDAEIAWHSGQTTKALEAWERAAESARRLGLTNDEALAYELAARSCESKGRADFTRLFARNAYQAYLRWGAVAKAQQIDRDFHTVINDTSDRPVSGALSVGDLVDLTVRDFQTATATFESSEFSNRVLDTTTVLRAAQTISGEIMLDRVLSKLLRLVLEHAGAQKACMLLSHDGKLHLEAIASVDGGASRRCNPPEPLETSTDVPISIVQYVARTKEPMVISDASRDEVFSQDGYVQRLNPLSVLCLPILQRGNVTGVVYVEHRWLTGVFTSQRVEVLSLLASQAAISIENARLYADLQSARDEYRALYVNAIEGLFRISGEGQLRSANPTLARLLGFDDVDALMEDYRDLIDRVFLKREAAQRFISELEENQLVNAFEAEGVRRDGTVFWMALTARLTVDPENGDYIDGSLIDISERIARDEADKQLQIAEAATQAKSEFLANMSHEIRTPMNAIVGFSRLALETELDRKQHEYLTSIRNAGENLVTLISDILDFSKIEAGKLTLEEHPYDPQEVLDEVGRLFRTDLRRKGLKFEVNNYLSDHADFPDSGMVVGDPLRLQQVMVNLVGNALKFTEEGAISVQAEVEKAAPPNGLVLRFHVRDTGIGISNDQKSRLFESFEQAETSTTRRYGGTGLGLTICRRLVQLMGGEIDVSSQQGEGSDFTFTIKVFNDIADSRPIRQDKRNRVRSGYLRGRRILVAEDNPINQQLASEFLRRIDAQVEIAANGREAVARITENTYDAVLMDIHMPELDGLEATRIVREQGIDIPIIAVSADALAERRGTALDAGCNGYVTKPIDFDTLLQELAIHLPPAEDVNLGRRSSDRATEEADEARAEHTAASIRQTRLPGIDMGQAIKAHNGNIRLLVKLMGDFGNYYGDAGARIREQIQSNDLEEAERLAHNLHGVAGSFGATRLKDASKALEKALAGAREGGPRESLVGLTQSFEIALTEVLESAERLASDEVPLRASDTPDA